MVNVLVLFRKGKETSDTFMDYMFYLEDLFGCNVDPMMKGEVKKRLKTSIISVVVYAQDCPFPFSRDISMSKKNRLIHRRIKTPVRRTVLTGTVPVPCILTPIR